jgi:phosphoglycolate phosphatase-like HAD superfamily hydrolase
LVFDFDGVIVDGMGEYWWSSRQACMTLVDTASGSESLPVEVPEAFRLLRPCIHYGWEMVLLAAELLRPDSPLRLQGPRAYAADYSLRSQQALEAWGWQPAQLQESLEQARRKAVAVDRSAWLARHRPFPGVVERLAGLAAEGVDWVVLTTKGAAFTAELLSSLQLLPSELYGHESGSKPEVLLRMASQRLLRGFVEDRRATLETVLATPGLASLPCYLASWGYLKPEDRQSLPRGIHLLEPEALASPLASWP